MIASDPALHRNLTLLRGITGFGEVSAALLLAELPNIAEFTPKALAAFAGWDWPDLVDGLGAWVVTAAS